MSEHFCVATGQWGQVFAWLFFNLTLDQARQLCELINRSMICNQTDYDTSIQIFYLNRYNS